MQRTKLTLGALVASTALAGMASAQTELTLWYHGAGNEVESNILGGIIEDFNGAQEDWQVTVESFPQESYNDSVVASALAGNLPCILDVDGPVMPNWAWAGYLQPLPISQEAIDGHLDATIGRWDGEIYSVGLWDAAVALYARQSTLDELGLRTPSLEEPWTKEEFMGALEAAKASGNYDFALDLGTAWTGEWYPYAFSPFLQSFGGDIVDRDGYQTAEGALNGEAAMEFGAWWQSLFAEGYAPGTSQDPADRDSGFIEGKYAFSWNGNWAAANTLASVENADDVVFLPAPDFGNGSTIGAASWQFGVSSACEHPEGAAAFVEHALQDEYLAAFSDGIGLIPATKEAAQMTESYAEGGPLAVFFDLSAEQALVRPVSPGYVVAAKVFEKALSDIANGADVADTLDAAVDEIDDDIEANQGYGH
ncbi:MAG: extracellular solute-binding protein [Marinovum algicola]|uniref:Carbohydrate ABC transporter substrate-binding protein, CUT1 family n=1 Tax=Marinovum algicola TaxID=42444 RepID=A0A975W6L1_9RHOB|nr:MULTISPECIES: extracellular solute-binding protein [Marinovum]AKO96007.1 ABC-type sugar transport system, periplasmic component [Marinovum algicola DG 898]MDD9741003.1 extracellular solute-binding protein [Marinovum sp. SP66]SEI61178.1 carbohydrate ABC transporter substrate-binding protein, CUT1 family [Marinovum algicola]SLN26135.1 Bacterial extracellular solute-binding protein [Marinovum algicola]